MPPVLQGSKKSGINRVKTKISQGGISCTFVLFNILLIKDQLLLVPVPALDPLIPLFVFQTFLYNLCC